MKATGYILVMGVCGVGKSSIGRKIAQAVGGDFVEADDLHSPENVALMAAGIPLEDDHRWRWLEEVAAAARQRMEAGKNKGPVIIACSALKVSYREFLRARLGDFTTLFLNGDKNLIRQRMLARKEHFMPPGLLDSQFSVLEPPTGEARVVEIDISGSMEDVIDKSFQACRQFSGEGITIAK